MFWNIFSLEFCSFFSSIFSSSAAMNTSYCKGYCILHDWLPAGRLPPQIQLCVSLIKSFACSWSWWDFFMVCLHSALSQLAIGYRGASCQVKMQYISNRYWGRTRCWLAFFCRIYCLDFPGGKDSKIETGLEWWKLTNVWGQYCVFLSVFQFGEKVSVVLFWYFKLKLAFHNPFPMESPCDNFGALLKVLYFC